jgi:hypothetical protein
MEPGVSRICAVCGLRCLNTPTLMRVARETLEEGTAAKVLEAVEERCGGCGGKFVV